MDEDENAAIRAMCLLGAENLSVLPPNAFEIHVAETKSKKPRKNYYVKKKFREDLPKFPMKAPRNFTIMPTADPRTDYPRLVMETLITADEEKFEALMKRIAAPDMLAIFQHHGSEDNPLGPNYREVLGVQNFIDFYLAVIHGAPDVITTIIKDSVKCSVDRDTNEAFIVFKLMCFGTQLMFVQEKEQGEEERELAEIMSHIDNNTENSIENGDISVINSYNSSIITNNDPNNEELLPPNKKQAINRKNNASNSTAGISAKDTKRVNQILKSKSYTFSKHNTSGSYRDCIVGPTTKVIKLSRGNLHTNNNSNTNTNNNITANSIYTSRVHGSRNGDNSEISSTLSDTAYNVVTPKNDEPNMSPNHSPIHSSDRGSARHSSTHLSADHSSTHFPTNGSTHSITHSETNTAAAGDCSIDSLVSSFNSFKLEPITNRPIVSTYHYGTYVIVSDANHKITRWYNFFKQTVGQAPAFPGMGTGVRDDIC